MATSFVKMDAINAAVEVADAAVSLQSHYIAFLAELNANDGKAPNWWTERMHEYYTAFVRAVATYDEVRRRP